MTDGPRLLANHPLKKVIDISIAMTAGYKQIHRPFELACYLPFG